MAPTPKSQDRKRKVTDDASSSTPAKRRVSKAAKNSESSSAAEAEDPFSFENKEDSHPEPLKNINIERTAFGGVKFSRSPPSASQRYAGIEKIAERRGNVSGTLITTPTSTPRPSSSTRPPIAETPKSVVAKASSAETPKATPKSRRVSTAAVVSAKGDSKQSKTVTTPNATPTTSLRSKRLSGVEFSNAATPKEKKMMLDDYCVPPTLTDDQQLNIDFAPQREEHKLLEPGARAFALWQKDYYAAVLCGRDAYGGYYTYFVEDNLKRLIPPNGVTPLSLLKNGTKITAIVDDEDGQPVGKLADIVEVPSHTNAAEWTKAIFKIKVDDEDDVIDISWSKIYLNQEQFKTISSLMPTNTTIFVEVENIVNESRSSRRSRAARFSTDGNAHMATPQPQASVNRTRDRISKTPKAAVTAEEPAAEKEAEEATNEEERETKKKEETVADVTPSRSARSARRSAAKSEQSTPNTPARSTPARGRRTPGRKAKETIVEEVDENEVDEEPAAQEATKVEENKAEISNATDSEAKESLEDNASSAKDAASPSKTSPIETKEEENTAENEKIEEDTKTEADETLEKMDVDEPAVEEPIQEPVEELTKLVDESIKTPSKDLLTSEATLKASPQKSIELPSPQKTPVVAASPEANGNSTTTPLDDEATKPSEQQQEVAVVNTSSGSQNGTVKEPESTAESVKTAVEKLTVEAPKSQPVSENSQPISIASLPAPSSEEEKAIFKDMKFVLTSATRAKKNSDFNKRDYRAKIEERGGNIIDDFSSLADGVKAYLIADTYYRTHKYLSALSLSVPCVKHDWIYACVTQKKFIDHVPFMLPAGESSLTDGEICSWKPLKGVLLANKRVWVYSNVLLRPDERAISFVDIWSSIIKNLGATLIEQTFASLDDKLEYCENKSVDILLTDTSCEKQLAEKVRNLNGLAVSSEWVIQAIVTGELPDVNSSERFRFDTSA